MNKLLISLLILFSSNANAGFMFGYIVGGMNSNHSITCNEDIQVNLRTPIVICQTNENGDYCSIRLERLPIGRYVKEKGYNFYYKNALINHCGSWYLILDVK